ncbi:FHA domain-containing protein [Streptomyces diacarni]|uniref:FHA domain-containing protein n=1 Tax=Streptomyces diacarni TaxID=2800381 RepID=A0A367ESS5_9ACTN|nr:FHA domain-containing protein [Streptomyces diacarni]RCG20635.1 FHA domain-containing protein [Streptomyces diacarni]
MHSIIVVPPEEWAAQGARRQAGQVRLAPGESLRFGREEECGLVLAHPGVSRSAGVLAASGSFWTLTNHSRDRTYVVENPEGAGEHIKVVPGRVEAPVPFEFSRVVLPAGDELVTFEVWAPRHDHLRTEPGADEGALTVPAFPLDRNSRYFRVLVALCEPRLRGEPYAPLPTTEQLTERLRTAWPEAGRASVQWNIDYLAVKLRLRPAPEDSPEGRARLNGKKEMLVALALRFDLVREDDLTLLGSARGRGRLDARPGGTVPA